MPIVVLLGLAVSMSFLEQPGLQFGFARAFLALPGVVVYLVVAAGIAAANTRSCLHRTGTVGPSKLARRHHRIGLLNQFWLVGGLAAVLAIGYRQAIIEARLTSFPLAGALAATFPFIAAMLLSWLLEYPYYHWTRRQVVESIEGRQGALGIWTRGQYLLYNIRHHLLMIAVPVFLIILLVDALSMYVGPYLPEKWASPIMGASSLASVTLVFLLSPLLIVRIWQTAPLPQGPIREELTAACRRLGLRCRGLRVWQSGRTIANAGVMGLAASVRYVLISDVLLDNLDRRGIGAIFAHEAGHILHHHILYSAMFAMSAAVLSAEFAARICGLFTLGGGAAEAMTVALLLAAWGFGFGWISRLFEQQSDVTGAYLAGLEASGPETPADDRITATGAQIFAAALERVAALNGMPARQWNWRHGSIARRIGYILWLGATGGRRGDVDRKVRRVKAMLWLATVVSAILAGMELFLD